MEQLECGFAYNKQNVDSVLEAVATFEADLSCTEILEPLEHSIYSIPVPDHVKKCIFLLTDGEVSNPQSVIELAKKASEEGLCKIHTIGVGRDCSKQLVEDVAKVGRGSCRIVLDNSKLRSQVIQALGRSG